MEVGKVLIGGIITITGEFRELEESGGEGMTSGLVESLVRMILLHGRPNSVGRL